MRELTIHELDAELAEALPARELMGSVPYRSAHVTNVAVAGNSSYGFINALNGNQVQILTAFSNNGNFASAG